MDRYEVLWKFPKCNVFLAKDLQLGDRVIYKMTSRHEVKVVNELLQKVPEIMPAIRDSLYDENKKIGYIIMELCAGDLTKLIQKRFSHRDFTKQLMKTLTEQVIKLHNAGYAHLDLKPENVVTLPVNILKLIDFETATKSQLLNELVGTPNYTPPEVIKGVDYNPRLADVWSLGICYIYIVTGKVLWELYGPTQQQKSLMSHYQKSRPQDPEIYARILTTEKVYFPSSFDPEFIDLLSRMLEIDPQNRIHLDAVIQHVFFR